MASPVVACPKSIRPSVSHEVLKAVKWFGVLMLVLVIGLPVTIYSRLTGDKTPWEPYRG